MKEVSSKDEDNISLLTAELYVCTYVVSRRMQEGRIMLQRIEIEFLEFRKAFRMVFSYVGEYQLIMYNEKTIYSRGVKGTITTTHAYGDAGYLIQGKKNKRKKVRCREAMCNIGNKDQGC